MTKTVFITGASGHIGSHVAHAFQRAGYRVKGLTRNEAGAARLRIAGVEPVTGNMQDAGSWSAAAETADVLIHAAADYTADTFALDRQATEELLAVSAKTGARFIYTSGVWMAGNTNGRVVDETARPNPVERIAARREIEPLVRANGGIVIRPGVVYGERAGLTAGWFSDQPVVGDGRNYWAMIHVEDLANAYVLAVEKADGGELLHIVDDSRLTVGEMVAAARKAAGIFTAVKWIPADEARKSIGNAAEALTIDQQIANTKAKQLLGWKPEKADFVKGAARYFDEWQGTQRHAA